MTFSNALANISAAADATRNATKIPRWHGYVYKTTGGLDETDVAAGQYRLVFVKSNGDQYIFLWNGVADFSYEGCLANVSGELAALTGSPVVGTTLVMDADLLEALTYDSWETAAQSYYEDQRTNTGVWD